MDETHIVKLAEQGCKAYDEYETDSLLSIARECMENGINPEYVLLLANECCGLYEFYNPVRLLRKSLECDSVGYDPVMILEWANKTISIDSQPVRILSEVIDRESFPGAGVSETF